MTIDPHRLINEAECHQLTSLSRTQRWRLEDLGLFPRRVKIGLRRNGWYEAEVRQWCEGRALTRRPVRQLEAA